MPSQTLVFNLSHILNYPIQLAVNGWQSERPLRWSSFNTEGLVAEGQFLEAPGLPLFTLEDDEGNRLSDRIPEDIAGLARLMPAIDFELAQACTVSEAARQLAMDSPLLFILLVDHARQEKLSDDAFAELLALKRMAILETIGLPGSKSLSRLIKRIRVSPLLPWELEDVIKALSKPEFLRLLRHHPDLHLNHLRFLLRHRRPFWPGMLYLVDEHSAGLDITSACRMIRDTFNMADGDERPLAGVNSRPALQALHDRLIERFNRGNGESAAAERAILAFDLTQEHGDYPAPPVLPITGVEPLASWLELLEEGAAMHHCVGSYDIPVAEGEVFVYRMKDPERLTISLESRNNQWILGEVRGYCNANPSPGALEIVRRWVAGLGNQSA